MATFDGPNKIITLGDPGISPTQSVPDIYSEWKTWSRLSDNLKWLPAFDLSVGGNDTNPPEKLDGYFFVRNDLGWRVKPFEATGVTTLAGNLFAFDTGTALYIATTGSFTAFIIGSVSSKALAVETGVSGLTPTESTQLGDIDTTTQSMDITLTSVDSRLASAETTLSSIDATVTLMDGTVTTLRKLMQNRMETNPTTGVMTIYDDDDITPLLTSNIYEDVLAAQLYRGRGMERRNRMT
jgi:hypothetical protein